MGLLPIYKASWGEVPGSERSEPTLEHAGTYLPL